MPNNRRIRFSARGSHPQLLLLRDHLIRSGYWLTEDDPHFYIAGAFTRSEETLTAPVLLLSSSVLYSDRDLDLRVRDESRGMREDEPILVPSSKVRDARNIANCLWQESWHQSAANPCIVLRTFDVYGPNVHHGLVYEMVRAAKAGKPIEIPKPGFQIRTHLHEDDFLTIATEMTNRLLAGHSGLYNLGSDEALSMMRLAESVKDLFKSNSDIVLVEREDTRWWVKPNMVRTKALTKYKSFKTIRSGLWEMANS